jgi:hypothetical protein
VNGIRRSDIRQQLDSVLSSARPRPTDCARARTNQYLSFVEANYGAIVPSSGPTEWDMEKQDAVLYASQLSGISPTVSSAIVALSARGGGRAAGHGRPTTSRRRSSPP